MDNLYLKMITEICNELEIKLELLDPTLLMILQKGEKRRYIWSKKFELNSATSFRIANSKFATHIVLERYHVPHIPCRRILFSGEDTSTIYHSIYMDFIRYKDIVLKPDNGYNGNDVYHCKSQEDIKAALVSIQKAYKYLVTAPFISTFSEYRIFYLNGNCLFGYEKTPDTEHGAWKHNLSVGAKAKHIESWELKNELYKLARQAAEAIGITFATVDIVIDKQQPLIMEINSGVVADIFASQSIQNYEIAKDIYKKAINAMFNQER